MSSAVSFGCRLKSVLLRCREAREWLVLPPLATLAIAAVIGLGVSHQVGSRVGLWFWGTAVVCAGCLFVRHRGFWSLAIFFSSSFALLHSITIEQIGRIPHRAAMLAGQEFEVTVTGIVVDEPRRAGQTGYRFPLKLESIRDRNGYSECEARVLVTIMNSAGGPPLYGDRIVVPGRLSIPGVPMNPGQFDMRGWFFQQGISADLFVPDGKSSLLASGQGNPLVAFSLKSRGWIRNRLTIGLEEDPATASVISAMVLGTRSETPEDIEEAFVGSGTMHVFAVSGLHVGLFGYLAWMFLKALGIRRPVAIALIIPGLILYAFITGLRPSACRATIMAVIILGGYLFDRVPSLPNSLGAAALVILFANTVQILQPGFQLSFIVLGAIVALAPVFRAPLQRLADPDPFLPRSLMSKLQRWIQAGGRKVAEIFSVSAAAWLGSAFLMLHHFEIATPIAVVANCFLVPCAFVILFISCVSISLGTLAGDAIALLCNNTNWLIAKGTVGLATMFAGLPGGGARSTGATGPPNSLHATVLYLQGGGGATHFAVNGGEQWLMDTGHSYDLRGIMFPFLEFRGVEKLDAMLLSHADSEHIGGAAQLSKLIRPRTTIVSKHPYRSPAFRLLESESNQSDQPDIFERVSDGREFTIGAGGVVRILYPPDPATMSIADDQGIVAQIDHLGWRILFMHDAGFATEKWLLDHCRYLDSDVLVKGRHQTDYSGLSEFLDAVSPDVIISSNAEFPIGERIPDRWRNRVEERGITLFDQAITGAVEIDATDRRLTLSSFTGTMRRVIVK